MVAVGAFFALRFALQPQDSQIFEVPPKFLGGSLEAAIRIQPRLWILSLKNILWPDALSADYQPGNVLALPLGVGLAGLVLFVGGQGFLAFKSRLAAMGMLMFWLGLAPVSNLVPIYRPIADRFLYMPLAGMALLVVGGLLLVAGRRMIFGLLFGLLVTGLILSLLPLSLATWRRQAVFANSIALWQDTLAKSPTSDTAANNLGFAFIRSGDHEAALEAFQLALNLTKGRKPNALAGVAIALESLNRPKEAEQYYQAAIADNAKYGDPDGLVERMEVNLDDADVLKQIQARLPALQKNRTP